MAWEAGMISGTEGYADAAPWLLSTRLDFDQVHEPILHLFPKARSCILDVGAGPGHDAATLAARGHSVVAVEPTPELHRGAVALYGCDQVHWIEDGLPHLDHVRKLRRRFDFILMSGVWMHLDESVRRDAMPTLASLLEPDGVLALSLRHGPVPVARRMFDVSAKETVALAETSGLRAILEVRRNSVQAANRAAGVTWTFLAFAAGL
jgi:SAM-dependent methyltransferase